MFLQEPRIRHDTGSIQHPSRAARTIPTSIRWTLAYRVGLDRSNLSEIVTGWSQAGLVRCSPSQQDRRAKVARLTAKGQQTIRKLSERPQVSCTPFGRSFAIAGQFVMMMKQVVGGKNDLPGFSMRDAG